MACRASLNADNTQIAFTAAVSAGVRPGLPCPVLTRARYRFMAADMQIPDLDVDSFLRDHWQKSPCLIRNPWGQWTNPLNPDSLAGLACEAGIESRLIEQTKDDWALAHGPFKASRFAKLGKRPWTLLVQAVDHHVPEVAELIAPFRFVPDWRIDDVMVSYASDGGGVGPHFDQYDVFLVQGLGRRRWRVGQRCDAATPLRSHDDLRLLADFEVTGEWVLEPGDILYVPPGIAHDGVAVGGDCMTYSIGFRAPSRGDLIAGYCDHLVETLSDDDRYADPDLKPQPNPGEIAVPALDRLHAMMTEALQDRAAFARWFGTFSSTRKYPDVDWEPDEPVETDTLRAMLNGGAPLYRNPASRFAFIRTGADAMDLFVDGACFPCSGALARLAERICAETVLEDVEISDDSLTLIAALIDQGSLAFEDDE